MDAIATETNTDADGAAGADAGDAAVTDDSRSRGAKLNKDRFEHGNDGDDAGVIGEPFNGNGEIDESTGEGHDDKHDGNDEKSAAVGDANDDNGSGDRTHGDRNAALAALLLLLLRGASLLSSARDSDGTANANGVVADPDPELVEPPPGDPGGDVDGDEDDDDDGEDKREGEVEHEDGDEDAAAAAAAVAAAASC